jgi:hypothetical protein
MIRRINLYGGPGCGKSTMATYLFSELKTRGINIEYVTEYIKFWTYIPRKPVSFDSVYCFAKQLHKEDTILRGETKLIVSDSPLMLQCFYAWYHEHNGEQSILELAKEVEDIYPSINVFLNRKDSYYSEIGRYENLEQAKKVDAEMKKFMKLMVSCQEFSCDDKKAILDYVLWAIEK